MTLRRRILQLFGLEPPPRADQLRLEHAALCVDCETLIPARGTGCIACGGRALLSLKRVLGGIRPEEAARLVEVEERGRSLLRFLHPRAGNIRDASGFDKHSKICGSRRMVTRRFSKPHIRNL